MERNFLRDIVGYFGCPPREALQDAAARAGASSCLVDLDVPCGAASSGLIPETSCRILHNIADNAFALRDRLFAVVASVGEDKCDGARFVASLLRSSGAVVEEVRNLNATPSPVIISTSSLPLRQKITGIMDTVATPPSAEAPPQCEPSHGFWGVPPNDLSLLDLFPPTTHVYGWARTVEAGVPSSLELERMVTPGVPTVFFVQTFCQKQIIAHELAARHGGLVVDIDTDLTQTARVKIEAFVRLINRQL